ncbi:hypothetical protein Q9233_007943, partial [Columba guinea]
DAASQQSELSPAHPASQILSSSLSLQHHGGVVIDCNRSQTKLYHLYQVSLLQMMSPDVLSSPQTSWPMHSTAELPPLVQAQVPDLSILPCPGQRDPDFRAFGSSGSTGFLKHDQQ